MKIIKKKARYDTRFVGAGFKPALRQKVTHRRRLRYGGKAGVQYKRAAFKAAPTEKNTFYILEVGFFTLRRIENLKFLRVCRNTLSANYTIKPAIHIEKRANYTIFRFGS